jgi:hypothetical protein
VEQLGERVGQPPRLAAAALAQVAAVGVLAAALDHPHLEDRQVVALAVGLDDQRVDGGAPGLPGAQQPDQADAAPRDAVDPLDVLDAVRPGDDLEVVRLEGGGRGAGGRRRRRAPRRPGG